MRNQAHSEPTSALASRNAPRQVASELLARLENAERPEEIVASANAVDLVAALREADDQQRVDLFQLLSAEQLTEAVDIACWRGGVFEPAALEAFVAPAVASGIDGATRVFASLEGEIRTLLLEPYVVVHLREDKNEDFPVPEGSELFECADGMYAVELPRPDAVPQTIRQILAALLYRPFEEYQPELECLRHDLPSELEEAAMRWRSGRLADMGFAPFEEGLAAISPLPPEELRARIRLPHESPSAAGDLPLPELYRRCLEGSSLLDAAMARLAGSRDPDRAARARSLPAELGAAVNLFLSGSRCDLGDLEATARGIERARNILALGLEAVSSADVETAAEALVAVAPLHLLRAGMGTLAPLKARARELVRKLGIATSGRPLDALDPPHALAVSLLGREIPARFPALDAGLATSPVPMAPIESELVAFASLAEVARVESLLAEAEGVPDLLARIGALDRESPLRGRPASVSLLTALANAASVRELRADPVSKEEADGLAQAAVETTFGDFAPQALRALAGPLGVRAEGDLHPDAEPDPRRRLVLRLLAVGFARLESAPAGEAMAVRPQSTR